MSTSPSAPETPRSDDSSPSPTPVANPSFLRYVYNHNPFYVISAFLMIYAVRSGYGKLEIGSINTWIMMGVLATYTLLLSGIVVLIVRKGKVWEDARSILVLLQFLFFAVSVSADDLFNTSVSYAAGTGLLFGGFLFSALVSEAVLKGAGIRLALGYRIPYHVMLALFYFAPWWYAPEIHPRDPVVLEWSLLAFPALAAMLMLALIPAIRGGERYNADNGTPWPWPWFPGIGFGVFAAIVAFRSYALCMTFGPTGPIWRQSSSGLSINFDTIWGPYFLVPLALACLALLVEIGLVTRNKNLLRGVMLAAPALLILALLQTNGGVQHRFMLTVMHALGSPLWLTAWSLFGFYAVAWYRRIPLAGAGAVTMILLLSVVGPSTISGRTMTAPQPWLFAVVRSVLIVRGIVKRSSFACSMGAVVAVYGVWYVLPQTAFAGYRNTIGFHTLWLAWLAIGLTMRDEFANLIRAATALAIPISALAALVGSASAEIPLTWRVTYVGGFAIVSLVIARIWRDRWFFTAFSILLLFGLYGGAAVAFRSAATVVNRATLTASLWSLAALIIAFMISAHKANWLPMRVALPPQPKDDDPPSIAE
ncbi:MAG: hypothetical protein O2955_15360 [Planctomycetota bacterium]|nr:hypothetical protein [Planctomycetota bacterium]